jgi:ketosteroid isomerase-like protein
MPLALLVPVLLLGCSASLRGQTSVGEVNAMTPTSNQQEEAEVKKVEDQEREAVLRGDLPAMTRIWSDHLIVNAPSNRVMTKEQVVDAVKAGRLDYRTFERQVEHITVSGDVVVTMGHETVVPINGPEAGKDVHRRFTNVWMKEGGEWKLIARQATVLAP